MKEKHEGKYIWWRRGKLWTTLYSEMIYYEEYMMKEMYSGNDVLVKEIDITNDMRAINEEPIEEVYYINDGIWREICLKRKEMSH